MVAVMFYYFMFSLAAVMWTLLIMTFLMNLLQGVLEFINDI